MREARENRLRQQLEEVKRQYDAGNPHDSLDSLKKVFRVVIILRDEFIILKIKRNFILSLMLL
jgi:hypothetical protein